MQFSDYVFHFTGKGNQSFVMKNSAGEPVYEAVCEKITLFRDTPFRFCDHRTKEETRKMIGHTKTTTLGSDHFGGTLDSTFQVDHVDVWNVLTEQGYSFRFHSRGLVACFHVFCNGEDVGTIETAGSGLINPKYKDSPLGKIPTNGIFKINCADQNVPGFFLICMAITKTEFSLKHMG